MHDQRPLRGDWGNVEVQPDHVMRVTTWSVALSNQSQTQINPDGTEVSVVVEGEPMLGTLRRAVLHFVPADHTRPPRVDPDGGLRCWLDRYGLDIALQQLRYPGVTLSFGHPEDSPSVAVLRTPQIRVSVR
ncbi:MAG: hypothetical protein AAFY65_18055 [Pseudomonadota bacterium]